MATDRTDSPVSQSREAARRGLDFVDALQERGSREAVRNLFLREWRRPQLEYKVPKPTPPGSRWQRLPTGHDLLSPLSYRDRHILNRAKNFVAVAAPHARGTNKCAWAWLRLAYPYSDSDFDLENYGVNHAESPPPRAKKAKGKKSRGASSRRST